MRSQLQKTWITITGVHTTTRKIEGDLRSGGKVMVGLNEIPPTFRWPIEGEVWSICRDTMDGVTWRLCDRVHNDQLDDEAPIENFEQGQMRLDADQVFNRQGLQLLTQVFNPEDPDTAPLNSLFCSNVDGKLYFKDDEGDNHALY